MLASGTRPSRKSSLQIRPHGHYRTGVCVEKRDTGQQWPRHSAVEEQKELSERVVDNITTDRHHSELSSRCGYRNPLAAARRRSPPFSTLFYPYLLFSTLLCSSLPFSTFLYCLCVLLVPCACHASITITNQLTAVCIIHIHCVNITHIHGTSPTLNQLLFLCTPCTALTAVLLQVAVNGDYIHTLK